MNLRHLLLFCFILALGCNNSNDPFADCRYKQPEPIFTSELEKVENHSFKMKGLQAIENLRFESGVGLTIVQSGCNAITQEYEFRIPGTFKGQEDHFWIEKVIEQFQYFSKLSPNYIAFNAWTQAIEGIQSEIQLGQFAELQPGYFIKIDKVLSSDHAILMLTLTEDP